MRKVRNKEVIKRVSDKGFRTNRVRNMIAVIAIALTAMLFTTIFTMGIGAVESFQYQTARQAGGDSHGAFKDITHEQYEKLKEHPLIKEYAPNILVADYVRNPEFLKRHMEMWYMPEYHYKHSFMEIIDGKAPQGADEILMDEVSLELLGLTPKVGQKVTLEMQIRQYEEKVVSRTFTVSGVLKADPALNIGFTVVSEAYLEKYEEELEQGKQSTTGMIRMDVIFANSLRIEEKLLQIITDSGYSILEEEPNFVACNGNWAYVSDGVGQDPMMIGALVSGILLIVLTGYLIIYNIFRISIMKDIRNYGLLKTIGTTGKQIRKIIRRQALWLGLIGIPLGLILGFLAGKALVPIILSVSSFSSSQVSVSLNPLIFIGAALFSMFTLLISIGRPARLAAKVSPIEAVRYTEGSRYQKKRMKKSAGGNKIYRMAFSNLARTKGKTIVVIASFSLAIILLNSIFTITHSFDMDTYLKKFVTTDFLIGNARYFSFDHYWALSQDSVEEENLTESFIAACEAAEGFEDGGRIYGAAREVALKVDSWTIPDYVNCDENGIPGTYYGGDFLPMNRNEAGDYETMFYGLDDFMLEQLEVWQGETDLQTIKEKLATGDYIVYAVRVDDNGKVEEEQIHHQPGDKVTLTYNGEEKEITILSLVKENMYGMTNRMSHDFSYYTTSEVFKQHFSPKYLMSYSFDVEDEKEEAVEAWLASYTSEVEPLMNYGSKFTYLGEFESLRNMVIMIGGLLTFVIGIIGILNFINSILTSIVTRKREFAMLEAIGMTKKQLVEMIMLEGIYYVVLTIVVSLAAGCLFSLTALRVLGGAMWFMKYRFTAVPMLTVFPVLLILGAVIPYLALRFHGTKSVVEELGKAE